jgi:hypothetical protein
MLTPVRSRDPCVLLLLLGPQSGTSKVMSGGSLRRAATCSANSSSGGASDTPWQQTGGISGCRQ